MNEEREEAVQEVGYGKPPKAHQFQKGQSGNPKGRPKTPTIKEIFRKFATGPIDDEYAKDRDIDPKMSSIELVVLRMLEDAERGHVDARKEVFRLYREIKTAASSQEAET
jgi:hypothetical protein